ncbi:hypothetical protein QOT17_011246 [Balamuthia mandrillaris]
MTSHAPDIFLSQLTELVESFTRLENEVDEFFNEALRPRVRGRYPPPSERFRRWQEKFLKDKN